MAEQELSRAPEDRDRERLAHDLHTRLGHFRPSGVGYTPEAGTDQEVDFEPEEVAILEAGPGFTPEGQTDLEQEELSGQT
ncbi:MAG: hypothetical protein HY331_00735 [Chloroflexi bacterium]|nr:hypothetical protein [Chloroflexota bacterium]